MLAVNSFQITMYNRHQQWMHFYCLGMLQALEFRTTNDRVAFRLILEEASSGSWMETTETSSNIISKYGYIARNKGQSFIASQWADFWSNQQRRTRMTSILPFVTITLNKYILTKMRTYYCPENIYLSKLTRKTMGKMWYMFRVNDKGSRTTSDVVCFLYC